MKIALIALLVVFLFADAVYLYFRLKKYWRQSSWSRRRGAAARKWRIGLSSLDIPLSKKSDDDRSPPQDTSTNFK